MGEAFETEEVSMNQKISDIFFNTDNEHCFPDGVLDHDTLIDSAGELLEQLEALGVNELPTPQQLAEDFLLRL